MKNLTTFFMLVFALCFFKTETSCSETEPSKITNKKLVIEMFEAIDRIDTSRIRELVSEDFKLTAPGVNEPLGIDALIFAMKAHFTSFPDWKHNIQELIIENNKIVAKVLQKGTHKSEYEGIPSTNKQVIMPAVYIFSVENEKINELWVIEDYLGLYSQLGMRLSQK